MPILVTGAAGFIGAAVSERLAARGDEVVGMESCYDYYRVVVSTERVAMRRSPASCSRIAASSRE